MDAQNGEVAGMTTTSTKAMQDQFRSRLMDFEEDGTALSDILSEMWINKVPDKGAVFPYGIMRIVDNTEDTDYSPVRNTIQLEVMIHGNKSAHETVVEDAADLCDMAMTDYVDSTSGLTFSRGRARSTAPATEDPAFRENATVRLLYELICWPLYLNTIGD